MCYQAGKLHNQTPLNFILLPYFYELLHNLDNFQRKLSHDNLFNYFIFLLSCFIILLLMRRFFNF